MIKPLLKFLSSFASECSANANYIKLNTIFGETTSELVDPNFIDRVLADIWRMVMNPWEYGLNAKGIVTCYELFKELNMLKEIYYGNKTKRS